MKFDSPVYSWPLSSSVTSIPVIAVTNSTVTTLHITLYGTMNFTTFTTHPEVSVVQEMFVPIRSLSLIRQALIVSESKPVWTYLGYAVFLNTSSVRHLGANPVVGSFFISKWIFSIVNSEGWYQTIGNNNWTLTAQSPWDGEPCRSPAACTCWPPSCPA